MNLKKQLTYTGVFAPLPIRLLNAIARPLKQISAKTVSLEIQHLLETACGKTQLEDFGDQSTLEPFEALIDSVGSDGKLTFFGLFTLRQFLIAKLCNRLRIIEALKRFPEIARQKIDRPVFITGWYRCGTTYLHNLLATHPDSRTPLYWELMHPCPAVDLEHNDAWLKSLPTGCKNKQEKNRERHQYTLSQFGLDADNIRRRFADYIKTYDLG